MEKCNMCGTDMPPRQRNIKKRQEICSKCYHKEYAKKRYKDKKTKIKPLTTHQKEIIKFVDRIEANGGWATIEDIYVNMITLFYDGDIRIVDRGIDHLSINSQLLYMWMRLQELSTQYKETHSNPS